MSESCGFCEIHDCWHGAPGEEARGERHAAASYLRRYAAAEHKHAAALRADAGTQAEPEARAVEMIARALEAAADTIAEGRHWR